MHRRERFSRRHFLRNAGTTAVLGAAGASSLVHPRSAAARDGHPDGNPARPFPPALDDYDFDEVYERKGTDSVRWDRAVNQYGDGIVAGMGVADMDFRAAPCVTRALAERCTHENWGYMHRPDSYAQAVAEWNHRRYGLDIDPSTIVFTTGVHPGIIAALHTFSPPGTRVLLQTPTYSGFYTDIRFSRTVADDSPMLVDADGRYSIDWDDFERRARRCNTFILCNPQNPTGNCWSAEDLTRMGEICLRHRVIVLADEIHCDFVTSGNTYTPFASLPDKELVDNSLTFKSASKSFSLAAMKVAWYHTTNPDLLERVKLNTRADLSTLGMVASRAALKEGEPWLDDLLAYLDANHDFATSFVRDNLPGITHHKGQGTYLAWFNVAEFADRIGAAETAARETAEGADEVTAEKIVQRWFAKRAGVFLNPGSNYGTGGGGYMRMNLASPRAIVERALNNMAAAVAEA
ncbi:MAG: aminotransferase class I/II-fold pyridoxal phosphate-dependent enzyme [Gemmatimonadota bacterium]|nr:aminotransferase class I/II-fold pyridoxal phosphate-dependent enzyme [Gemmatimonadota bacterium]